MKICLALMALVGLVAASSPLEENKDKMVKQKFLYEIVYRVEDTLMFEDYIKLGTSFVYHKDDYENPPQDYELFMDRYYKAYKYGGNLPKGEFYGVMIPHHQEQMMGLFGIFYYAKTWEIFQRNVCWARLYANEALFVQALTLAVMHRPDMQGIQLPAIYEIFPEYFLNNKFVFEAQKFDYKVWSKLIMYEKQYKDVMYKDYAKYFKEFEGYYHYYYTKDWKVWQWWKLMGLGDNWYAEEDTQDGMKTFWMPVDYTREINFHNKESGLSYFTEDLDWNAYFYYFNMAFAPMLQGKSFALDQQRRGEFYAFTVRQILARYYLERLSHGQGVIPAVNHYAVLEHGYNPQLLHYNGLSFSSRHNDYDMKTFGNQDLYKEMANFRRRLDAIIEQGYYTLANGTNMDLRHPKAIEFIGNMMQGNVDAEFGHNWLQYVHMYFADVDPEAASIEPHVLLNYETMLRDPLFYMSLKKLPDHYDLFHKYIKPYTKEELMLPGVVINDVKISKLLTYFELHDYDASNLMNDRLTFVDGEFVWDQTLKARQMRLSHKDFDFMLTIKSEHKMPVVIRSFLAPKFDEDGRIITLTENRENFWELDKSVWQLDVGSNTINLSSTHFSGTIPERLSYSQRYYDLKHNPADPMNYDESSQGYCGFPNRLLLPRGWDGGMPVQFFFMVTPYQESESKAFKSLKTCTPYADDLPFGYPFDREIDEYEFFTPNMYFKDFRIYHDELWEKLHDVEVFSQLGSFNSKFYKKIVEEYKH
uniref:Larval serum protein 1 gamma chain n=1 Tax=Stomoxys calcitrans TaxID=35570 RepID=A0A1I8PQQ2_STOCA